MAALACFSFNPSQSMIDEVEQTIGKIRDPLTSILIVTKEDISSDIEPEIRRAIQTYRQYLYNFNDELKFPDVKESIKLLKRFCDVTLDWPEEIILFR